jgi:hypothetical protein
MFGVALVQTFVFGLQARRLRETIDKMDVVSKDSSRIGQAQVRAYVSVDSAKVTMKEIDIFGNKFADEPHFEIAVSNTGNSPALYFRTSFEITYLHHGPSNVVSGLDLGSGGEATGKNIPAGKTIYLPLTGHRARLSEYELGVFNRGDLQIVITVKSLFVDVFDNRIEHIDSFRAHFPSGRLRQEIAMHPSHFGAARWSEIQTAAAAAAKEQHENSDKQGEGDP